MVTARERRKEITESKLVGSGGMPRPPTAAITTNTTIKPLSIQTGMCGIEIQTAKWPPFSFFKKKTISKIYKMGKTELEKTSKKWILRNCHVQILECLNLIYYMIYIYL